MRITHINTVGKEDVLARPIYGDDGTVLLAAGARVFAYRERLRRLGISLLYIVDRATADTPSPEGDEEPLAVDEVVSQEIRAKGQRTVRALFEAVEAGRRCDMDDVYGAVADIMDQVLRSRRSQVQFAEVRALHDHTFSHSVAVCVLSLIMGQRMGLDTDRLGILGVGALLHDLGKAKVPAYVWRKAGRLTAEEQRLVRSHTTEGFRILRENPDVSLVAAHIAYQHHERIDGSGYPRGIPGHEMHRLAKIVAVADVYDALTTDRAYRPRVYPYHALLYLFSQCDRAFDAAVVRALGRSVAPFPVGATVRLNSGEVGRVVMNNPGFPFRPQVMVESSAEGHEIRDLTRDAGLLVTHVLPGAR